MDALVTGGAGFIGSSLVRALVDGGASVRVLDDLSTGSEANLEGVEAEVVLADVRDAAAVRRAAEEVEVVFHLAALPTVSRSLADPVASHEVNVTGTLNVLLAARDAGARRLVYASSSSVYGDTPELPKHEGMAVAPRSPYAAAKLAGEAYCRAFARSFDLETVSLRFFNVFGPRQDPASEYAAVIPRFISRVLADEPPVIHGDGEQSRDFTYVDNAVLACVQAATAGPDASAEAMNVGCGERVTLLELLDLIAGVCGREAIPVFTPPRPGDVRHSLAATEKAERLLGYRPRVRLRDGLAHTARWLASRTEVEHAG